MPVKKADLGKVPKTKNFINQRTQRGGIADATFVEINPSVTSTNALTGFIQRSLKRAGYN